jgi:hypothetical protein
LKKLLLPLCLLLVLFTRDTPRARACGGTYTFSPITAGLLGVPEDVDELGYLREEATFLYPYHVAYPRESEPLWQFSDRDSPAPPLDEAPLSRAIAASDSNAIRREAMRLIDAWYRMPPVLAAVQRDKMLRAVQQLEPPGVPSAGRELIDLMADFDERVPNGWSGGVQAPALFAQHLRDIDAWSARNPKHPLLDLARFWRLRPLVFSGDLETAWSSLFRLYPKRRVRALAEMQYLTRLGSKPTARQLDALTDPLLVALFADTTTTTPARYARWWKLSERAPENVSVALQERLLAVAARKPASVPLPPSFPARAAKRTQYWGKLRAVLLRQHARAAEAEEQLEMLAAEPEQAAMLASTRLALGDPLKAARAPKLNADDVLYLLHVRLPRAKLLELQRDPDVAIRDHALRAAALDRLAKDDYRGAALLLQPVDAEQASDLKQMAELRKNHDTLGLARALRRHKQSLVLKIEPWVYRGLDEALAQLPADGAEAKRLGAVLRDCSGSFRALRLLVEWLEQHPAATNARAVLQEADGAYIELGAYGSYDNLFWSRYLKHHDLAQRLRRVGKEIRARQPTTPLPQ